MRIRPKFLKSQNDALHQANSHSGLYAPKQYSRKKVISPVSSETAIRKEMQPSNPSAPAASAKNKKRFLTVNLSDNAGHEKLIALSSKLDEKLRRRRKLFAFIAKVMLWGIIFYILVLSALPAVDMIVSRWQY